MTRINMIFLGNRKSKREREMTKSAKEYTVYIPIQRKWNKYDLPSGWGWVWKLILERESMDKSLKGLSVVISLVRLVL